MHASVLRLLYEGLAPVGSRDPAALPFSPEDLASSALRLPDVSDASGTSAEIAGRASWTPCEKNGIRWLERPASGLPGPVYISGASTSSLDVARRLLEADLLPEWGSVLSLSQSAGRGQMRRAWSSPAGNLYSALRLPMTAPFDTFAAAPACGALLAEALERAGCPVMLKWPNDLLQSAAPCRPGVMPGREDCRKVGGMLLEERNGALTVGTGINLTSCPPTSSLRDNYAFSAGVLMRKHGVPLMKSATETENDGKDKGGVTIFTLWNQLAASLFSCYSEKKPLDSWWPVLAEKHLAFRGCRVTLADACPEKETLVRIPCEGVVDGVTETGALRLRTAYGTETFLGGSLLPGDAAERNLSDRDPSSE